MINLTKQERLVLLFLAGVIIVGSLLQIIVKQSPPVRKLFESTEQSQALQKLDLNSANMTELEKIPYIGKATAAAILKARETRGSFKSIDELRTIKGIGPRKFELIKPFFKIDHDQ